MQHNATQQSYTDEDVERFAALSQELKNEYLQSPTEDLWSKSPFNWIRSRPSRQRGKIGEQLLSSWCTAGGLSVRKSPDSEADRIIENVRVEIKMSTLWENGVYTFQQIRDQDYEAIVFLGISPFGVHAWAFWKKDIPFDALDHQHGGIAGTDTWWVSFAPGHEPDWMGGSGQLANVMKFFSDLQRTTREVNLHRSKA